LPVFKGIDWWEWSHRQLGRTIGVVFAIPFLFFLLTGRTTKKLLPHLLSPVCARRTAGRHRVVDGGVGCVNSAADIAALVPPDHPLLPGAADHRRQLLAVARTRRDAARGRRFRPSHGRMRSSGSSASRWRLRALVAGSDAGVGYTDWPSMLGRGDPRGTMWTLDPFWRNLFQNVRRRLQSLAQAYGQWIARCRGPVRVDVSGDALVAVPAVWRTGRGAGRARHRNVLMHAAPLDMSLAHQALVRDRLASRPPWLVLDCAPRRISLPRIAFMPASVVVPRHPDD